MAGLGRKSNPAIIYQLKTSQQLYMWFWTQRMGEQGSFLKDFKVNWGVSQIGGKRGDPNCLRILSSVSAEVFVCCVLVWVSKKKQNETSGQRVVRLPKGTEERCSLAGLGWLETHLWRDMLGSIMDSELKDATVYSLVNKESVKDFDQG